MSKGENVESLSETLKQNSKFLNKRFGGKIVKTHAKAQTSPTVSLAALEKLEYKAYKLFLKLIDIESSRKLCVIDAEVAKLRTDIAEKTGWYVTESGATYRDNFKNMDDPEFREFDSYQIFRTEETGFYVSQSEPYNLYEKGIREKEQRFLDNNLVTLNTLDSLWKEKSKIMHGDYTLKNPTEENIKLAQELSMYLGYCPSESQDISR